jgi:hypothetical protein
VAEPELSPEAAPRYTARFVLHIRLSRGGYVYGYEIDYDGQVIGGLNVTRASRNEPEEKVYNLGDAVFQTAADLIAAHERSRSGT